MPADFTYPLYPIANIVSAVLLLFVLATGFVRQSWNLGVFLLSFWLFWELLAAGISAIIWADNADLKAFIYCDIVSHLQVFLSRIKPACTLIITRRLYKIAAMQSIHGPTRGERLFDLFFELSLGLFLPALQTGVIYYVFQVNRFSVIEGLGCRNAYMPSGLSFILFDSWPIILPGISALFYCPKILWVFYRHSRNTNKYLQSNRSVSRNGYMRVLALGCLDIFFTLPLGILSLVLEVQGSIDNLGSVLFYGGWSETHAAFAPVSVSAAMLQAQGTPDLVYSYLSEWASPVLGLCIFALFGLTSEARESYRQVVGRAAACVGWKEGAAGGKAAQVTRSEIVFGAREGRAGRGGAMTVMPSDDIVSFGTLQSSEVQESMDPGKVNDAQDGLSDVESGPVNSRSGSSSESELGQPDKQV